MTDETMPPGLWQETRRAADAWTQARGPRGGQPAAAGPPEIGQVLILQELREPRLAWVVMRREAGDNARLLVVAADVNPLVGSGDVATAGPAIGALTLRCRFAVWASERELGATALMASLPPEALSLAEFRLQAIAGGGPVGTFSEHETEEDPAYQDWIEDVVRPAVDKLATRAGIDAPGTPPVLPFPSPRPAEPTPSPRGDWMRWAAVLAFVGLGVASGFVWWRQAQEIAGLRAATEAREAAHRQAIAELEARRAALEGQYQARLRAVGEDRARLEAEHSARLQDIEAELEALRQATAVKNPLVASLDREDVQRGPRRFEIGLEVSHLVLLLPVDDPVGTEHEVEVTERHSGKQASVQKGLRVDVLGEVRLGLPAALLPPGDYRLRLFRKKDGKLEMVREHLITITEGTRRRPPRW